MGFMNSCLDILLRFATFTDYFDHKEGQLVFDLPSGTIQPRPSIGGVSFSPQNASITCQYPSLTGWQACNSATDRSCWLTDPRKRNQIWQYNITTDYEDFTPPGINREYWLEVNQAAISPDGYVKELGLVFNNSYPGPLIEACWGDTVTVHVTNKVNNNGTGIHWHGIRQLHTNQMDGTNAVTQCPIAQNDTYTYTFRIQQYGHTWYHSHYQLQYSDGLAAPLTIYGPTSDDFDEAVQPILMNDWMHDDALDLFREELAGGIPVVDSLVVGGKGSFLCSDLDPKCCSACKNQFCTPDPACANSSNPTGSAYSLTVKARKRYLLRLVNSSTGSMFIFSIDNHTLEVVATDLVPIKPYKTDSIFIGIGQRYQVIVEMNPDIPSLDGNYWIRTRVATGCGSVAQDTETTGILRYNPSSKGSPSSTPQQFRTLCEDEPAESLVPVVPWKIGSFQNTPTSNVYEAGLDLQPEHGFIRWSLADQALFLNYSNPAILQTEQPISQFPDDYAIVNYNYTATKGYVYLIITGENITSTKRPIPAAHPIHVHGHDFVILAQKNSTFNESTEVPTFNLNNPARRDVAMLYAGGYLALAFRPDNPGVWLVHCHIAFHAASGLALQVLENEGAIVGSLGGEGALKGVRDGCAKWDEWNLRYNQTDSGI